MKDREAMGLRHDQRPLAAPASESASEQTSSNTQGAGPGEEKLRGLIARHGYTISVEAVAEVTEAHPRERDELFAIIQNQLGNHYTGQLLAHLDPPQSETTEDEEGADEATEAGPDHESEGGRDAEEESGEETDEEVDERESEEMLEGARQRVASVAAEQAEQQVEGFGASDGTKSAPASPLLSAAADTKPDAAPKPPQVASALRVWIYKGDKLVSIQVFASSGKAGKEASASLDQEKGWTWAGPNATEAHGMTANGRLMTEWAQAQGADRIEVKSFPVGEGREGESNKLVEYGKNGGTGEKGGARSSMRAFMDWVTGGWWDKHMPSIVLPELASAALDVATIGAEGVSLAVAPSMFINLLRRDILKNAVKKLAGRRGRQQQLRKLMNDLKVSSADRGWIRNETRRIKRSSRKAIRVPPGKELAHVRGKEAAKGFSYEHSVLQGEDLHRNQHKFDKFGRWKRKP